MSAALQQDSHRLGKSDEDDQDEEMDDVQEFQQKMLEAGRCLQCFNGLLLAVGALLTAFAFVGAEQLGSISALPFLSWVPYAVSGTGFLLVGWTLMGCLGGLLKQSGTKLLLLYYTCLVFAALALTIFGGFCFILTDTATTTIDENWDEFVAGLEPEQRESIDQDQVKQNLQMYMYGIGAIAWLVVVLLAVAMGAIVQLVTPIQAKSMLLQATTIGILPIGIGLIAAGLYVADTAATVEAPIAAFSIFVMGMLVLLVTTLGCVGTTLHSRGIILTFMYLISVLSLLFIGFGITALVQADSVREYIVARWDSLRRVLPPTFSGKFDRTVFEAYVTSNLRIMGFMALCAGVVLVIMFHASYQLRYELKRQTLLDKDIDKLYDELTATFDRIRDAIEGLKAAKRAVRTESGWDKAQVDGRVQMLVVEEDRRYRGLKAQIEMDDAATDEDIEALLAADPPPARGEQGALYNLRCAVYQRVRVSAKKSDIEADLEDKELDANMLAGVQGAHRMKQDAEERAQSGGTPAAEALRYAISGQTVDADKKKLRDKDLADLTIRKRRIVRQRNPLQQFWKERWTKGTARSRQLIICCCSCLAFVAVAIMTMAVLALYFSTTCSTLGDFSVEHVYTKAQLEEAGTDVTGLSGPGLGNAFRLSHDATRGTLSIELDADSTAAEGTSVRATKRAYRRSLANPEFPPAVLDEETGEVVVALPQKEPTRLANFDISCQTTDIAVLVPPKSSTGPALSAPRADLDVTGDYAGVLIDWVDFPAASRPRLPFLSANTSGGAIELIGAVIGAEGMELNSALGEISMEYVDARCDPLLLGTAEGGVHMTTSKGSIFVDGSAFIDCEVEAIGDAALVQVSRSIVRNTQGGGALRLQGRKGLVDFSNSAAEVVDIKSESGSVFVSDVNVTESLRVATLGGSVKVDGMRMSPRAVMQIDTGEGLITVHCSQFSGILSIVTGGSVSCSGTGFDAYDPNAETQVDFCPVEEGRTDGLKVVEEVAVNCETAGPGGSNDCPYRGEVTITSTAGAVRVVMD